MALSTHVMCWPDQLPMPGEPLQLQLKPLNPSGDSYTAVLAMRPGGMLVAEIVDNTVATVMEPSDEADFRQRTDDEIRRARDRAAAGEGSPVLAQVGSMPAHMLPRIAATPGPAPAEGETNTPPVPPPAPPPAPPQAADEGVDLLAPNPDLAAPVGDGANRAEGGPPAAVASFLQP